MTTVVTPNLIQHMMLVVATRMEFFGGFCKNNYIKLNYRNPWHWDACIKTQVTWT